MALLSAVFPYREYDHQPSGNATFLIPHVSRTLLVIPHFRDSVRFGPFLEELTAILPSHFAVLVSDDGSGPTEVARLSSLLSRKQASLGPSAPTLLDPLLHESNTGKGAAVVRGWQLGKDYSLLAFADADGAVSASEILRAERVLSLTEDLRRPLGKSHQDAREIHPEKPPPACEWPHLRNARLGGQRTSCL